LQSSSNRVGYNPAGFGAPELRCIGCSAIYLEPARDFRCTSCGDLLEAVYAPPSQPDAAALRGLWRERKTSLAAADQSGVWRFREMLPILPGGAGAVTLREGNTPVYSMPRCAGSAGIDTLLAKHQGMNPTGSFKDTGMTAALSVAKAKGFEWVGCASTGNTSASMAAYAARAGMRALVLLPDGKISWGKLAQSIEYGAHTVQLKTDFDGCVRVLLEIIRDFPLYLLNSMNPYRLEGQKTTAFELMEQLDWNVPDHVIVPGGNLANSSAIGKGFHEMLGLGLISRLPRISIIQAAGANPLVRSVREFGGERIEPVQAETRATAIRIGNPASWKKAVGVLRETGGACEEVSEQEIAEAKYEIGVEGIGCEPASAATLAGLKKLTRSGFVQRTESVVLVLTGHCLKDPEFTLDQRKPALAMDADAGAVIRLLQGMASLDNAGGAA
jgi:threonine synthase